MTDELRDLIKEKLVKINPTKVGFEILDLAVGYDCVFSLLWPDYNADVKLHERINKARTTKEFSYEQIIETFVTHFKSESDHGVDQFVYSYLSLVKQHASKKVSAEIGEFLDIFVEEINEMKVLALDESPDASFFENMSVMSEEGEIPFYEQLSPIYDEVITTLFSEKSHVPIIYTPQDKLRSAVFAHIAHKFSDFDAPVTINTANIYHLSAKTVLSSLLTSPAMLMEAIDKDLDEIVRKTGGGVIIVDEVDSFFDSGENILLRRIYNSCRARKLFLILGSNKRPVSEFWMEPIAVNVTVDVEDVVDGYMRHMAHNYSLSINTEALDLIKKVSGSMFSKQDFSSIVRLIEKSAAEVSYSIFKPNQKIVEAKRELSDLIASPVREDETFDQTVGEIVKRINSELDIQLGDTKSSMTIEREHVNSALKKFFNIRVEDLDTVEERMLTLEDKLNEEIFGQEDAVKVISESLMRSFSGLFDHNGPVGVFCALGESGVGKTFMAKILQKVIYGDRELIRIDMGEYVDKTSTNRLLGAGAGYVGYEEGSAFFESIKKNPRSVVLIDEIEKATPEIADAFLKIFDEGYSTDNKGDKIDFTQVIFIVTGNIGSKSLQAIAKPTMGFIQDSPELNELEKLNNAKEELKKHFRPEFLNRIDEIIYFKPLKENTISKILSKKIQTLISSFEKKSIKIDFTEEVLSVLTKKCIDPIHNGARLVNKVFRDNVETPAAKQFFAGNKDIKVSEENGNVKFSQNQ